MEQPNTPQKRGGTRPGAGRPRKITNAILIHVPADMAGTVKEIREMLYAELAKIKDPINIIPIRKINKAILLLHCARKYATSSGAILKATGIAADGLKIQFKVIGEIPPGPEWHLIEFIEEPVFFARYFMLI